MTVAIGRRSGHSSDPFAACLHQAIMGLATEGLDAGHRRGPIV